MTTIKKIEDKRGLTCGYLFPNGNIEQPEFIDWAHVEIEWPAIQLPKFDFEATAFTFGKANIGSFIKGQLFK